VTNPQAGFEVAGTRNGEQFIATFALQQSTENLTPMTNKKQGPLLLPFFDALNYIKKQLPPNHLSQIQKNDFSISQSFLKSYSGSLGTFNSYRREVERLLHWCYLIAYKSLKQLKRDDIEEFIRFCQNPNKLWIGIKKASRFVEKEGLRVPNSDWRPFVATVSKAAHRQGKQPNSKNFELSQGAVKEILAILSTLYNYLLQDEYVSMNPVALIRQKSKFIRKQQGQVKIRRLSELQWHYVIKTAEELAEKNADKHERTLFIMSALYSMYLRISELAASARWVPTMNHFQRDGDGNWWFTTVGKGNKQRQIAVSNAMLVALKRWRKHCELSLLPSLADNSPLLPKTRGKGPITNTSYIRKIVQYCFDRTMEALHKDNHTEEAESLVEATVHWLRHTGISDDVKHRPREHVRDDAGHSSSATTDKYIDIELRERHRSAKNKPLVIEN
jgi:site-specific recombinase XerD